MDHAEKVAFIAGLPTLVSGGLAYLLGRKQTVNQASIAREATAADEERTALEGWQDLAAEYRSDRQRILDDFEKLRAEFQGLRAEVSDLKRKDAENRTWRRLALDYIRTLVGAMQVAHLDVPPPPPGLAIEDSSGL